ncbi:MAG TPA: septum site-determining protein MinC [Sulfuriferula sp.]|nr:septum site-determining protein MinC [Sulfuriferula sp.]
MSHKKLPYFELRNGTVDTLLFIAKTTDLSALRAELSRRFEATPGFFANDIVTIDLRRLENERIAVAELVALLNEFRLRPIGIAATDAQRDWAGAEDIPFVELHERRDANKPASEAAVPDLSPEPPLQASAPPNGEHAMPAAAATVVIDKPLRSGQQIYAGGDLVVLGQVSFGAELIAAGSIHIYAPMRGRALAGVHGDHGARIFCTCFEPELVAIAGIYRTAEIPLPDDVLGKPVQVRLDNEKLIIEPLRLT